jgi:histidinol-phosphate aminotransferase
MVGLPQLRPALAGIPTYKPGKPPSPARDGLASYKLSSNENPYPPLPGVLEAVTEAAGAMNRYPDMGLTTLYAELSERLSVPTSHLAAGTGSVALLYHLLQASCAEGDEVVYAWRSFEAYPIAVQITGATPVQVPLAAGARHDLDAMAAAITERTRVVVVCTPNNPTGPAVRAGELTAFLDQVPADVLVVVDEAYREFVRNADLVDGIALYRDRPNVCALRTFSKAYGLAGLRVGYLVAAEPVADAVRKCSLPFGVSDLAQAAAVASLRAEPALLARVEALVAERSRVVTALAAQGWDVPDAQGNFCWLPLGEQSLDFATATTRAGVSVRPFPGDGVRITIGEPEANDLLLAVAAQWRRSTG